MTISDDEKWLEKLAGRGDGSSKDSDKQADILRSVMQEKYRTEMDLMGQPDVEKLKQLLERCRHEGLLETEKSWWQRRYWVPELAAVAAICLMLIVGVNVIGEQKIAGPDTVVYRGGPEAKSIKYVSEPMAEANHLQSALKKAGVEDVLIYQTDGNWILKATLVRPLSERVGAILKGQQLSVTEHGILEVEFAKQE